MQTNLNIPLYLVAPDDRRDKVITEVNRPTFSRLSPLLGRFKNDRDALLCGGSGTRHKSQPRSTKMTPTFPTPWKNYLKTNVFNSGSIVVSNLPLNPVAL